MDSPTRPPVRVEHRVEVGRSVVGVGQVEELVAIASQVARRCQEPAEILGIPRESHLAPLSLRVDGGQCLPSDEVVVELDERAVSQLPRIACSSPRCCPTRSCRRAHWSPRSCPHAATRGTAVVPRWCRSPEAATGSSPTPTCWPSRHATRMAPGRTHDPPRGWRHVPSRSCSYGPQISRPGAPAMPWRSVRTRSPATFRCPIRKNSHLLDRTAVDLLDDRPRLRALDLEAPQIPLDRLAVRAHRRPLVPADVHVVASAASEAQVVGDGRPSDEYELLVGQVEQNAVTDDAAPRGTPERTAWPCPPGSWPCC